MSLYQQICSESFFFCLLQCWAWWWFQYPFLFLYLFFITEMWFLSLVSMHEGVFTNDYLSDDFFGILFCDYWKVELDDGILFYCSFFLKFNFCITEMWFLSQISMQLYWRSSFIRLLVDQQRQPNVYFSISILKYPWPLVSIKNW